MRRPGVSSPLWWGFFGVILLLALLTTFALLSGGRQLAELEAPHQAQAVQRMMYILLHGQRRMVPEASREQLSMDMQKALEREQNQLQREWESHIDTAVDTVFSPVHDHVADFADWYYSLAGEYTRYAHAIGGDMGRYLQQRFVESVFLPAALETNLNSLPGNLNQALLQKMRQSGARLASQMELLTEAGSWLASANAPLMGETLDLDFILELLLAPDSADFSRQVLASFAALGSGVVIAKGMGAMVVKKTLAKVAGTQSFHLASALLAKLAAKSAIKGGGALAGAGAGAVICSPTGPGALLCGIVGGVAAWLAVDKAVIELDEALNREQFEEDIHEALSSQQDILKSELKAAYGQVLVETFAPMLQGAETLSAPVGKVRPVDSLFSPEDSDDYEKPVASPAR